MLNPCYSEIWQNFGGDEYLCKLGKEYLNALICKFVTYSLQHSETFDVFWRLSNTNHRWVINAQTGPFFSAHPVHEHIRSRSSDLQLSYGYLTIK